MATETRETLGEFEHLLLLAIVHLGEDADVRDDSPGNRSQDGPRHLAIGLSARRSIDSSAKGSSARRCPSRHRTEGADRTVLPHQAGGSRGLPASARRLVRMREVDAGFPRSGRTPLPPRLLEWLMQVLLDRGIATPSWAIFTGSIVFAQRKTVHALPLDGAAELRRSLVPNVRRRFEQRETRGQRTHRGTLGDDSERKAWSTI